jgi:hypothetical protein
MKNEKNIQENVERAMQSIEGMHRAEANAFLYTRVMQAIENKKAKSAFEKNRFARLAFALLIFMSVNIYTFIHFQKAETQSTTKQGIEAFANEYGFSDNSNS